MVKKLSEGDKAEIANAIKIAERRTSAEIVVVIAPASDTYHSYLLLFGFIGGSFLSLALWVSKLIAIFPILLAVQVATMTLACFVPALRRTLICFIPHKVLRHRAGHCAYEEYLNATRHVSSVTPVALLFISIAERYAHIQTSRHVREKISDKIWEQAIKSFTSSVGTNGLKATVITTIQNMANELCIPFPDRGEPNSAPGLIEVKE
jgi:putative membrane protein